jgi:hypothetical protein
VAHVWHICMYYIDRIFYLIVKHHSCQTKCWMNNYRNLYQTRTITLFASFKLKAKHIPSSQLLQLAMFIVQIFFMTIQKCITYIKVTSWANKRQTSSQLQVGKWMKISNSPQNMTCYKNNTCVYRAPTSFTNQMNWKS